MLAARSGNDDHKGKGKGSKGHKGGGKGSKNQKGGKSSKSDKTEQKNSSKYGNKSNKTDGKNQDKQAKKANQPYILVIGGIIFLAFLFFVYKQTQTVAPIAAQALKSGAIPV